MTKVIWPAALTVTVPVAVTPPFGGGGQVTVVLRGGDEDAVGVGVAFDGLETGVHLAGARDVGAFTKFFHHGEDGLRRLVE